MSLEARDTGVEIAADSGRVIGRLFLPGESVSPSRSRVGIIAERVMALDPEVAAAQAEEIVADFSPRHDKLVELLEIHAIAALVSVGMDVPESEAYRRLLGATFTNEYAVEGAALCNPSVVEHPDQSGLDPDQLRVIVSLREIGEGHVSTMGFAIAVITGRDSWEFEERDFPLAHAVITQPESMWHSYHASFDHDSTLSQRVLQPAVAEEKNGIEDARFVRFTDHDGTVDYRGTYTAYDGVLVAPRMVITSDFRTFTSHRLLGPASTNKGVALFPRPVGGEYLALVRSNGETNCIARSNDGFEWHSETHAFGPLEPWELVQSGNCGSPIETPQGWLVMTHGVGPMRVYSMGAALLDLDDPTKVLAWLEQPLIRSVDAKQNGYVPNVVYSCGSILHDGMLWIPYGVGDNRVRVACVDVDELIAAMTPA